MTPVRLLVLAVLFYCAWLLLRRRPVKQEKDTPSTVDNGRAEDVLVEDPVCHVLVPKNQALRVHRDGVTYYFCSEKCCDQFAGQPEKDEQ